ncbi:hypothetical protein G9A89_014425 [Geosiphon pyriformis]|nr:hypothetical protein G9A89_014425 [Geosiphon pyriformis]
MEKAITANEWNDVRAIQAISYFLKDTADSWYQSLINKPQDFNAFKVEFLRYFSNNNSINHLVNTLTTIKQGKTEAVTTYLGHFHRNLHQIQAIDTNYFTASQILNQFIHGLYNSILQHVHSLYPSTLQDTVTRTKDFKSAESKTNYAQAVNLVMKRSSELDSKLKQFTIQETTIVPKIKHVPQHWPISSGSQRCVSTTTVISTKLGTILKHLSANDAAANLLSTSISDSSLSTTATSNISTAATCNISTAATSNLSNLINSNTAPEFTMIVHQLIPSSSNLLSGSHSQNLGTSATQNPNFQNYLSLLIIPEDATTNNSGSNQQQALTNNILPATVTNDELLMAIFPFDLEKMIKILLFSEAALEKKPITTMYTDAKINGHTIKLILNSGSADSIITRQLMDQLANRVIKTPISEINNLPIKINGIMVPIKVFKETKKPTWEAYQVSKGKQKEEHTWETTIGAWIDNNQNELPPTLSWEEKGKGKEREDNLPKEMESTKDTTSGWTSSYSIVRRNSLPWELGLHQMKITKCEPTIIASLATANGMATQKDKTSGTMNYVSLAANSCSIKECGITFLVKEERVTLHANTQSSLATG